MPTAKMTSAMKKKGGADLRTRIRKRAERDRWMKANKKRIMYAVIGFFVVVLAAVFTPVGPEYYYNNLQKKKMDGKNLAPGYVEGLHKLALFYSYTFRGDDALRCYNEIGTLFFGFGISEYALNPNASLDKRYAAEAKIKQGQIAGPPFTVPDKELPLVGNAIWKVGEMVQKEKPRPVIVRIYQDLYVDWFQGEYPQACDKEAMEAVQGFLNRKR